MFSSIFFYFFIKNKFLIFRKWFILLKIQIIGPIGWIRNILCHDVKALNYNNNFCEV